MAQSSRIDWLILSVLAVSLTGNVLLGSSAYSEYSTKRKTERARQGAQIGDHLRPLLATKFGGSREEPIALSTTSPTMFYVMRTGCVWCQRNASNFDAIRKGAKMPIVVVALDVAPELVEPYAATIGKDVQAVYFNPNPDSISDWGLNVTPQTLVVSERGIVLKTWRGAYVGDTKREIETFFALQLPGLAQLSAPSKPQ